MIKTVNYFLQFPLTRQLIKFGFVGGFATILNYVIVVLVVEFIHLPPLLANIIAFLIACQVSYRGHKHWTFRAHDVPHRQAMLKFFILSVLGFILNESLFAFFLKVIHLHYTIALLIVLLIVPPITFVISKFWAFKS